MSEPGAQLEIVDTEDGLRLSGEIDAHTAPQLDAALSALVGRGGTIRLQIGDVSFMDSSGLRVVIATTETLRAGGGDLVLDQPSELVRRLLSVSGLTEHLTLTPPQP